MFLQVSQYDGVGKPQWQEAKKKIRITLIQPPNLHGVKSLLSHMGEKGESIGFKPPLGLLWIATYLKINSLHEVKIIDAQAEGMDFSECLRQIEEFKPQLIGISAWTDWWYPAYELCRIIKNSLPGVHICLGGPHVAIYPEETLAIQYVDSVVVGDGEVPFFVLSNMLANNIIDNTFPGLHFKGCGAKEDQGQFYIEDDLNDLPNPDRRLLPLKNYTSVLGKTGFMTTMITSRGCPFQCVFCKLNFQKTIFRSAENIIQEFKEIQKLGIREVEIYDDTFTSSKIRAIQICQGLIDEKIKIKWSVRDRVSAADPELLDLMRKAGCTRIHYGIESGVDRILGLMKKNITTQQSRNAVYLAKKNRFTVLAYYMFGNQGETIQDIKATIAFAIELDADYAEFSITIPYPGTELYSQGLKDGIIDSDYWREFALNPTKDFFPRKLAIEHTSLDELVAFRDKAIRSYYFRPKFIFRELLKINNFGEFIRKARMGFRLKCSLNNSNYNNRKAAYED